MLHRAESEGPEGQASGTLLRCAGSRNRSSRQHSRSAEACKGASVTMSLNECTQIIPILPIHPKRAPRTSKGGSLLPPNPVLNSQDKDYKDGPECTTRNQQERSFEAPLIRHQEHWPLRETPCCRNTKQHHTPYLANVARPNNRRTPHCKCMVAFSCLQSNHAPSRTGGRARDVGRLYALCPGTLFQDVADGSSWPCDGYQRSLCGCITSARWILPVRVHRTF